MSVSGGDDEGSRKMKKIAEIRVNQFQQFGRIRRVSEEQSYGSEELVRQGDFSLGTVVGKSWELVLGVGNDGSSEDPSRAGREARADQSHPTGEMLGWSTKCCSRWCYEA
jgi:hypothetical protein